MSTEEGVKRKDAESVCSVFARLQTINVSITLQNVHPLFPPLWGKYFKIGLRLH